MRFTKNNKLFFIFGMLFVLIPLVSSIPPSDELHLNIQTTDVSGNVETGTFIFTFNISTVLDCSNIVYTKVDTLTTDSRGVISYYLEDVNFTFKEQHWLCYYRDGDLKSAFKIAKTPHAYSVDEITDDDISDSTNLTLGQKITFAFEEAIDNIIDGWIRITGGLNVTENVEVGGNVTANYFIGDGSQLTNIPGSVSVINFTNSDYDGNVTNGSLTGYEAANNICDNEFSGAHMCTQHEVSSYIALVGAASLSVSQISWVIAGGAKYAPADHPVNDCSGFTNDGTGATDPLGSFWSFNNINGGKGIAGNCGLSYPLACCK